MLAIIVVVGAIVYLALPAVQGYHLGSCNSTDYSVATSWASQNVGSGTQGRVFTINRLFAWCKADEHPADYQVGGSSTPANSTPASSGSPPPVTLVECAPGGGCYLVPGNSLSNMTAGDEPFECQPIKPGFTPAVDNPCGYGADQETPVS